MSGEVPGPGNKEPETIPPPAGLTTPSHGHIQFKFLEQLKRRNVGRIAILYVIVCYLIVEPFSMLVHVLALPEWIGRTVVVLMVLGFPVALIVAWVFEVTPQGLKPTTTVDPRQSMRRLTGRRLDVAIIVVLVIALAYFAVDKFWLSKRLVTSTTTVPVAAGPSGVAAAPAVLEKSIAVLPFTDIRRVARQRPLSSWTQKMSWPISYWGISVLRTIGTGQPPNGNTNR